MNFKKINLDKVLKYTQPTKHIVQSTEYGDKFKTPVLTAGKNFLLGYTNEKEGIYKDIPAIIFDDFTTSFHYVDFPFKVKSSALKILNVRSNQVDIKYVYYQMKGVKIDTQLHKRYWISRFSKKQIPLPPLETQKQIAQTLDNAAALRDKTQQLLTEYDQLAESIFLDMFGDPVTNPNGWEENKMSSICCKVTDGTHDTPERLKEGIKFITGKHIRPYKIEYENSDYVTENTHNEIFKRCNPEKNDVLYTNIGVNLGTAALNSVEYEFSMKNVALLKPNDDLIKGRYLEFFLNNINMKKKILWIASIGGAQKFLSLNQLRKLKVLVPPIHLQNQFVEKIALIEQQKDLAKQELQESEDLFQALLQKAFHPSEKHDESELV